MPLACLHSPSCWSLSVFQFPASFCLSYSYPQRTVLVPDAVADPTMCISRVNVLCVGSHLVDLLLYSCLYHAVCSLSFFCLCLPLPMMAGKRMPCHAMSCYIDSCSMCHSFLFSIRLRQHFPFIEQQKFEEKLFSKTHQAINGKVVNECDVLTTPIDHVHTPQLR